jgi:hypothetical protein
VALGQIGCIEDESWMRLCRAQAYVLLDRAGDARHEAELGCRGGERLAHAARSGGGLGIAGTPQRR